MDQTSTQWPKEGARVTRRVTGSPRHSPKCSSNARQSPHDRRMNRPITENPMGRNILPYGPRNPGLYGPRDDGAQIPGGRNKVRLYGPSHSYSMDQRPTGEQ